MSMRVLGLVPARGGSRRIEGKNLAELGGKTLVRRALETALACIRLDLVAISSDSAEILAQAEGLDAVTRIERSHDLATDSARSLDVVLHALEVVEDRGTAPFDAVAILQCTSPFTEPPDIDGTIELLERSGAGSAVTVSKVDHAHPLKMKRMEGDRLLPLFRDDDMLPSHELPEVFVRNGSVYVSRRATLESGSLVSEDVRGHLMPLERSLDIDTLVDLEFARFLLQRRVTTE